MGGRSLVAGHRPDGLTPTDRDRRREIERALERGASDDRALGAGGPQRAEVVERGDPARDDDGQPERITRSRARARPDRSGSPTRATRSSRRTARRRARRATEGLGEREVHLVRGRATGSDRRRSRPRPPAARRSRSSRRPVVDDGRRAPPSPGRRGRIPRSRSAVISPARRDPLRSPAPRAPSATIARRTSSVARLAREREIEIDHVQPGGAGRQGGARRGDRVAAEGVDRDRAVRGRPGSRPPATSIAGITSNVTPEPYRPPVTRA